MEGEGVLEYGDGRKYSGQFFNDKKHGFGVYRWPDGVEYSGFWKENK